MKNVFQVFDLKSPFKNFLIDAFVLIIIIFYNKMLVFYNNILY